MSRFDADFPLSSRASTRTQHAPIIAKCSACGRGFPSKYARKTHVCHGDLDG